MKGTSELVFTPSGKEPVAEEPQNWFRDFVCDLCRCFLSFLNGFIHGLRMVVGSPVVPLPESDFSYLRRSFTLGTILAGAICGILLGLVVACVGCVLGEYMEDRSFGNARSDSCRNGGCVGIFMGMSLMVGFVIRRLTYLRPKTLSWVSTKHSEIEEVTLHEFESFSGGYGFRHLSRRKHTDGVRLVVVRRGLTFDFIPDLCLTEWRRRQSVIGSDLSFSSDWIRGDIYERTDTARPNIYSINCARELAIINLFFSKWQECKAKITLILWTWER